MIEEVNQNRYFTLQSIRIIIFQLPMLKDFYSSMQERQISSSKPMTWFQGLCNMWSSMKGKVREKGNVYLDTKVLCMFHVFMFVVFPVLAMLTVKADEPKKVEKLVIETLNADPACFHICGQSQVKLNLAKKKLQDLINDQYHSLDILDNAIQSLSIEDCQHISDIQRSLGISLSTKNIQEQLVLVVSGHKPDVYKASSEINAILRNAKEKRDAELGGLMTAWQYQSHGFRFKNFNPETNYKLEQAWKNLDSYVEVTIKGKQYTVRMPQEPATDNQGRTLEVNRVDLTKGILLVPSD